LGAAFRGIGREVNNGTRIGGFFCVRARLRLRAENKKARKSGLS